jgi:hypothetical protein
MLEAFLAFHRQVLVRKVSGLAEEDAVSPRAVEEYARRPGQTHDRRETRLVPVGPSGLLGSRHKTSAQCRRRRG